MSFAARRFGNGLFVDMEGPVNERSDVGSLRAGEGAAEASSTMNPADIRWLSPETQSIMKRIRRELALSIRGDGARSRTP